MTRNWAVFWLLGVLSACSAAEGEVVDVKAERLVGADEFLYLRCNATGWGVDAATRLEPTADPYLFSLEFEVKEGWMLSGGDQCIVTKTNAKDGWGTAQAFYGAPDASAITVPGGWPLRSQSAQYASVRYPELGRYRATVNWRDGAVIVERAASASVDCGGQECAVGGDTVCCHDRRTDGYLCAEREDCAALTLGETAVLGCDDAGDCASGTVCCAANAYLGYTSQCLAPELCVDGPSGRYWTTRDQVCSSDAQCGGGDCTSGIWPEFSICQ